MALVVLLRGVNVGGHRACRPRALADQLAHLGTVNIGAAGTFVVRRPVTRARLRAEVARRLPFHTEVVICDGREVTDLVSQDCFAGQPARPDIVRFVTVLSRRPRAAPPLPAAFPADGQWLLQILGRNDRFVYGHYRRHMKAIGYLGSVERIFGVPATTRNWNTIVSIAGVLDRPSPQGEHDTTNGE